MSGQTGFINAVIDGRDVRAPAGTTILKAAESIGIKIPVYCYHPRLTVAGSCRMCLVEVEKIPKPVTSCSTELADGMVVHTNTPAVLKARAGIMELLLINHPLDCPVCDKGGECMLQDNSYAWGSGKVRFSEERRRFIKPVPLSDRILLDRERCILCTRCVRFCNEISGHRQLTVADRGHMSIIDTAPGREFDSQYSGNTTEICPVGALTSKQFRFKARPWEMESTASICPYCGCGCNIFINARSGKILRFMSRENPDVDDGWLCDRGRYGFESINNADRLKTPLIRKSGRLVEASWDEALSAAVDGLKKALKRLGPGSIAGIGSEQGTNEENEGLQTLIRESIGSPNIDCVLGEDGRPLALLISQGLADFRITDIDAVDAIILIGADTGKNQPIIDLRLKKAVRMNGALLTTLKGLEKTPDGSLTGKRIVALVDESLINDETDVRSFRNIIQVLGSRSKGGILLKSANGFGARMSGAVPGYLPDLAPAEKGLSGRDMLESSEHGGIKALYMLSIENGHAETLSRMRRSAEIIIGHSMFINDATGFVDVVFPAAAFSEKQGTFTNTAGIRQKINAALKPPGETRAEVEVIRDIAERLKK